MIFDFSKSYFELFDLPVAYGLDMVRLDVAYRDIQSQIHPDRFVNSSEAERRRSIQWAAFANEAYQTLKSPLARARYLVKLNGVDTEEETNTAMPADFLYEQMEWREAIATAKEERDSSALDSLEKKLAIESRTRLAALETKIDVERDYKRAAEAVRELRFLEKLRDEIEFALESIEELKE